jgi:Abi-like protein
LRSEQVARWVGETRFQRYLDARDGQHERAVALYIWNARVCAAFLEVLCHLEVLLRNAIDRQFPASTPGGSLSILDSKVWLCDPAILTLESREKVNEAIARLQSERKRPTRGRVIASLSFGFWQALFSGAYEDLWRNTLFRAFPNGDGSRREIASQAGSILHFRNRIAHHEAIFFSDLTARHDQILQLAGAIDAEAARYIQNVSSVEALLSGRP